MGTFTLPAKQTMVPGFPVNNFYTKAQSDAKFALIGSGGISLTTNGSSGAATLINGVLNIPIYSGGGGGISTISSPNGTLTIANPTTTPTIDINYSIKSVSTTYIALTADDTVLCDATSASFTINLLDATTVTVGRPYTFKKIDTTANEIQLLPNGVQTIDGAPYQTIVAAKSSVTIKSDGANWQVF